jgi:hypothetical protein
LTDASHSSRRGRRVKKRARKSALGRLAKAMINLGSWCKNQIEVCNVLVAKLDNEARIKNLSESWMRKGTCEHILRIVHQIEGES